MPLSSYSILQPPFVAVRLAGTQADFTFLSQDPLYNFGVVDTVNYLCNKADVGDIALFKQTDAVLITAGGTDYYIITDDNQFFKQVIVL